MTTTERTIRTIGTILILALGLALIISQALNPVAFQL